MPRNDSFSREYPPVFNLPKADEIVIKSYAHNPIYRVLMDALGYEIKNNTVFRSSNAMKSIVNVAMTVDKGKESELFQMRCTDGSMSFNNEDGFWIESTWQVVQR